MTAYTDLILVLGVGILALAFPAMVGAFSRGAPPRVAMLAIMIGGGMIIYANATRPGGYSVEQMPALVAEVILG